MVKGKIIILSGPSGSGKTTLYKKLLASPKFKGRLVKTVSVTTRPRRAGEKRDRDYIFVSLAKFLYKKRAGHFLECQKVFDNYYGTPSKNVFELMRKGKNVLLCIDVKGAKVVCLKLPEAVRIFVKTPSLRELRKRLEKRGSETQQSLNLRLKIARQELLQAKDYDKVVINDQFDTCYSELESIISDIIENP